MENAKLIQEKDKTITQLQEQLFCAQQQLDWFKRQLFGRKSEKFIEDNPQQSSLFTSAPAGTSPAPTTEVKTHKRSSQKKHNDSDVNETGLRFDESVPQEIIELSAPELQGENSNDYEVVDIKETTRLAQRPGSYVVLRYRRPVVRHKGKK